MFQRPSVYSSKRLCCSEPTLPEGCRGKPFWKYLEGHEKDNGPQAPGLWLAPHQCLNNSVHTCRAWGVSAPSLGLEHKLCVPSHPCWGPSSQSSPASGHLGLVVVLHGHGDDVEADDEGYEEVQVVAGAQRMDGAACV